MANNELHEQHMKNILTAISTHEIGQFLAFKGGTLAYRKYNLDRFSTDIDLDLLDINQENIIIEKMEEILVGLGDIKNKTVGKDMHRRIFGYDQESMNIKVEINKRIWKNNSYELQNVKDITISCMTPDCIFANKLVALSERSIPRDLYDVYFFFREKFPINEALIAERTGVSVREFLQQLKKELPKLFPENRILAGLGEVLSTKQKSWVKNHLLSETTDQIKIFLASKK